jgi:hypothetical protein
MDFMIPFGHYWLMCMALMEEANGLTYILLSSALGVGAGWFAYKPIDGQGVGGGYFIYWSLCLMIVYVAFNQNEKDVYYYLVVPMMFFGLCVRFAWDVIYKGSVQ